MLLHESAPTAPLLHQNYLFVSLYPGFPGGSAVKNLPAKQETRILSLGWEDPPEKEMATHSSILAWGIPWTEEPGRLHVHEVAKSQSDTT